MSRIAAKPPALESFQHLSPGEDHSQVNNSYSEYALDATAFFLADVADGLGPFLVIYLTTIRGWNATDAGTSMAVLLIASVVCQSFAGSWIDRTRFKRYSIATAAIVVAICSITLCYAKSKLAVFGLQGLIGSAVTLIAPAIAAISLGMVGRANLPRRAGRNEACFHAGNVASAGLALTANYLLGPIGIFYSVATMAIASAISSLMIRERDIDHLLARGADDVVEGQQESIATIASVLQNRQLQWFTISVVLFHFANAAMLPLVGQKVGQSYPEHATSLMALCIIVAQVTMVPVAFLASYLAVNSRRKIFLVGFFVLPIRGILYSVCSGSVPLIAIQILDGLGAGIFGVVALLVMADLTRGSGRFNFAQGVVATAIAIGAAASNFATGLIADNWGYDAGFQFLSTVAMVALVVFALKVPETKGI